MLAGQLKNRSFRIGVRLVGYNIEDHARTATVAVSFAPLSTVTTMSASAPIPRFADTSVSRQLFKKND
jgi:hypothetical protein